MKTPQDNDHLANQALTSLDNLQQVEANAYLYAKIVNRMQLARQNIAARHTRLMFRLTAALLLLLCVNITGFYLLKKQQPGSKKANGITALSQEYFPQNDSYNY